MSTRERSTLESVAVRASRPLLLAGAAVFAYALFELASTGVATGTLFGGAVVLAIGLMYLRW